MTDTDRPDARRPVVLGPSEGRAYPMGPLTAVFKADGTESDHRYSISEWWLEPRTKGPGTHHHPEDDVFYVLAGTMSLRVDGTWTDAPAGTFVLVPADVPHDFENRTDERAGMLNITVPGDFEEQLPGIVEWFRDRPEEEARV
jgi:mannose-6-phosphate isomerase-like protein (cupin superfamily)